MESSPATAASHRFGKYSLVARLATGGMAEIFLARLQGAAGFEKLVCIKRILPHLARDRHFVSMFLAEAQIAARISHPNVCQVFELGELEGSYYIAMEYLEGVPLACFRRGDYYGPEPDPRLVAGIAVQACEGLHHAHQLRHTDGSVMEVVHRDISPQNLFVTTDGIVKVLDFGIAKIHGGQIQTTSGALKGTYAYMAPEQLRSERVDRRTDVFAVGIVMWETLARRHLFKRETDFLTFQAITAEPITDLQAIRPDVPPALASVIMTALARDRDQRFPTTRMLGEAIGAAVAPLGSAAISEELVHAFPVQLAEQAELIRVAREGGSLDLDVERGPSVGHGAELLTTPISQLLGMGNGAAGAPEPSRPRASSPADAVPRPLPRPTVPSGAIRRLDGTPSVVALQPTPIPAPAPAPSPAGRSWRPLVIAAIALGIGGAGAVVYSRVAGERERVAARAPAPAPAPVAAAPAPAATPSAPPPQPSPPTQPMVAVPSETPQNAAPSVAAKAVEKRGSAATAPRPAPPARPSGPPGYITIDSSPMYATIYIDGKNYGETPVVKIELSPGRHVVHAVAPSGAARDVRIAIEAGKVSPAMRISW
jgi:serine/threonine-protein kinase